MRFCLTSSLLVASLVSTASGFAPSIAQRAIVSSPQRKNDRIAASLRMKDHDDDVAKFDCSESITNNNHRSLKSSAAVASFWSITAVAANAAGPDWGIFEGRTGSLLHPITMFGMFALSAYTAFLGFQWRRQRTIGDEISDLKKTVPKYEASSLSDAIAMARAEEDYDKVATLEAASKIEREIAALQQERKDLATAGPRDRHYAQGAVLAFVGTAFAIEGPLNTYARAGKLFPGPHLYAGAGLVVLWALAVACVPFMQKGNEAARTVHIGANLVGVGFFAWQVQSGIPILLKVIEKTSWP